jgi:hypothetical protein
MGMTTSTSSSAAFRAPSLSLLATEPLRAALDFISGKVGGKPSAIGDGHAVVVYPGLGGGALTTSHLRKFLRQSGFDAHDWQGGINTGPEGDLDEWLGMHVERVRALRAGSGRPVSLVGWSLGGVYAREVAKLCAPAVRRVITLGTPFGAMRDANHAGTIFKLLGGDTSQLTPELAARQRERPPVPTTSIYSKADGVVCWQGCIESEDEGVENVEVSASHLGMGVHPEVLRVVASRLSGAPSPSAGSRAGASARRPH